MARVDPCAAPRVVPAWLRSVVPGVDAWPLRDAEAARDAYFAAVSDRLAGSCVEEKVARALNGEYDVLPVLPGADARIAHARCALAGARGLRLHFDTQSKFCEYDSGGEGWSGNITLGGPASIREMARVIGARADWSHPATTRLDRVFLDLQWLRLGLDSEVYDAVADLLLALRDNETPAVELRISARDLEDIQTSEYPAETEKARRDLGLALFFLLTRNVKSLTVDASYSYSFCDESDAALYSKVLPRMPKLECFCLHDRRFLDCGGAGRRLRDRLRALVGLMPNLTHFEAVLSDGHNTTQYPHVPTGLELAALLPNLQCLRYPADDYAPFRALRAVCIDHYADDDGSSNYFARLKNCENLQLILTTKCISATRYGLAAGSGIRPDAYADFVRRGVTYENYETYFGHHAPDRHTPVPALYARAARAPTAAAAPAEEARARRVTVAAADGRRVALHTRSAALLAHADRWGGVFRADDAEFAAALAESGRPARTRAGKRALADLASGDRAKLARCAEVAGALDLLSARDAALRALCGAALDA